MEKDYALLKKSIIKEYRKYDSVHLLSNRSYIEALSKQHYTEYNDLTEYLSHFIMCLDRMPLSYLNKAGRTVLFIRGLLRTFGNSLTRYIRYTKGNLSKKYDKLLITA